MQNNNPLFAAQCVAVDRIVNGKWGKSKQEPEGSDRLAVEIWKEWEDEPTEKKRSIIVAIAGAGKQLARRLWRVARRVQLPARSPASKEVGTKSLPIS